MSYARILLFALAGYALLVVLAFVVRYLTA